ncbi:MAG: CHAT domain-containing protein, partial [Planctomycetota bacterium]|nr:CHAT domain-containing protein [Planctomycetota bacterium]
MAGQPGDALRAADAVSMTGDSVVEVRIKILRAHALWSGDAVGRAHKGFADAAEAAHQMGYLDGAVEALHEAAKTAYIRRDFEAARGHWKRRLAIDTERGDLRGQASTLGAIGKAHQDEADFYGSIVWFERALEIAEPLQDPAITGHLLERFSTSYMYLGQFTKALGYAERGATLIEKGGDPEARYQSLTTIAGLRGSMGDKEGALASYKQALELNEKVVRNAVWRAQARSNLAIACNSLKRYDEARDYALQAIRICEDLNHPSLANALAVAAYANIGLKQYEDALAYSEELTEVAERFRNPRIRLFALLTRGAANLYAGNHDEAIKILEPGLELAEEQGSRDAVLIIRAGIAMAHQRAGRAREAAEANRLAVASVGEVFQGLGDDLGASARKQYSEIFETGALAARDLGNAEDLCFFLESGRAATLLESMGGRDRLRTATLSERLRKQEMKARSRLRGARAKLEEAEKSGDLQESMDRKADLNAARDDLKQTIESMQREAKAAAQVLYPHAAPLKEIQGWLGDGEALVLYGLFSEDALALVVTAGGARVVPLGKKETIAEACASLDLGDREFEYVEPLAVLRRLVIEPLALEKKTRRLLISPDDALAEGVPFAALVEDREVVYVPSGSTYGFLQAERGLRGKKILAVGDPRYSGKLAALPHTRAEAKSIGDVVLLGEKATEAGLADAVGKRERWRAVHIACHGLVDPDRPTLSSLALSPSGDDDGYLRTYEILRMKIPADLVVLSACET